nr:reverse transcriptase domain-containing protein [Tanacetum cinerariifolium]
MSTRSSKRNIFPPLENPKLTIRRRTRVDPNILNDFNMAINGNGDNQPPPEGGDLPVLDLRTMEELCQPTLNGRGVPIAIQETNFGLKNDMIQQVQNSCPYHGPGDDANKHLDKFLHVTQSMKVNRVSDDALRLYIFPYSLQHPYQALGYQALVHQALIPQPQVVTTTEFYMKANDAILKNMQTDMTTLTNSTNDLKNMMGQFMKMNTASTSGLGTLPNNTITNPKENLKGIITRSGIAYKGPTIPTTSSPPKVVDVKPILHDQKLREKANDQMEKFFQIFQDLNFNISIADALILMPKFASTIKSLLTNKEKLFELARTALNEHCSAVLLKKLPEKLGDPDKRSFLKTGHALIDVYEGELTLYVGNKAVTFNLDRTSRYFANYDAELINRIDIIDVACEEYFKEVLGFSVSGNPTPSTEPIVSTSSPTLTSFEDSDFLLEETDAFLAIEDEPISLEIDHSYYDSEGDILFLEKFLNDDPSSPPLPPQELKVVEPKNEKSSINKPPVVELKDLPPYLEYEFLEGDDKLSVIIAKDLKDEEKTALIKEKSHFMVKEGIVLGHKILKNEIKVDKAKVDVIAKLPHPTTVKGIQSFLGHAGLELPVLSLVIATSGQVEVSNRGLKRILERTVCENRASWSDKLDDTL